jgi:hypothetical protein
MTTDQVQPHYKIPLRPALVRRGKVVTTIETAAIINNPVISNSSNIVAAPIIESIPLIETFQLRDSNPLKR